MPRLKMSPSTKTRDALFDSEAAVGADVDADLVAVDVLSAEILRLCAARETSPGEQEDEGETGETKPAQASQGVTEGVQARGHEKSTSVTARCASSSISKKSAFTKPNILAMITLGKDSTVVLKVRTAPL